MEESEVYLPDVISELVTDRNFVENWRQLYDKLQLNNFDIVSLDSQRKSGNLKIYDLLTQILDAWISSRGKRATIQVLHDALASLEFNLLAEKLKQFPMESSLTTIIPTKRIKLDPQPSRSETTLEVPYWFGVHSPTNKFVGRQNELDKLHSFHAVGENPVYLQNVITELVKDEYFVDNWKRLYMKLQLENFDIALLENERKRGVLKIDDLLTQIFTAWISCKGKNATIQSLYDALVSLKFNFIAENLKKFPMESFITTSSTSITRCMPDPQPSRSETTLEVPYWFGVHIPTNKFVGRENELKKLHSFYADKKAKLILVCGMGGIGKTQLTIAFAKTFYNDEKGSVIWLEGNSEGSFVKSINRLTGWKKAGNADLLYDNMFKAFKLVYNSLKTNPSLIIIDNVDQRNLVIEFFIKSVKALPPKNIPVMLVTSRKIDILGDVSCTLELKTLDFVAAKKFILESLEDETDPDSVDLLCETLQCFPLALNQAVGYIREKRKTSEQFRFSVSDYINVFNAEKTKLLSHPINELEAQYTKTTLTTWSVTLAAIKSKPGIGQVAVKMLNIIAYSELEGIELDRLKKMCFKITSNCEDDCTQNLWDLAIRLIRSYCLCHVFEEYGRSVISMHCLLQEVIKLSNVEQKKTQFFKSFVTIRNISSQFETLFENIWLDMLKIETFVADNIESLFKLCLMVYRKRTIWHKTVLLVSTYNEVVKRVFKTESEKWTYLTQTCMPLLLQHDNNDMYYKLLVSLFLDIKPIILENHKLATNFFSMEILPDPYETVNIFDKEIQINVLVKIFRLQIKFNNSAHIKYIRSFLNYIINALCVRNYTNELIKIQQFLCQSYFKNRLNKEQVLELLKLVEIGMQMVEINSEVDLEFNDISILGIVSYSNQLTHFFSGSFRMRNMAYYSDISTSSVHSLLSKLIPFNLSLWIEDNIDRFSSSDYLKYCTNLLQRKLKSQTVCPIDAYCLAQMYLYKVNLKTNILHINRGLKKLLEDIVSKKYILADKYLNAEKSWNGIHDSQIDNLMIHPPVFLHKEKTHTLNNMQSENSNISSDDIQTKLNNAMLTLSFIDVDQKVNEHDVDLEDEMVVENGEFVWKIKHNRVTSRKVVIQKMREAAYEDFQISVLENLKLVNKSRDSEFRYETFWGAAKLLQVQFSTIINYKGNQKLSVESLFEIAEISLELAVNEYERSIFLPDLRQLADLFRLTWFIFGNAKFSLLELKTYVFLIFLKYFDLNTTFLKDIFWDSKNCQSDLRSLIQKVIDLIKDKKVLNPQDGFRAIKLISVELLKKEGSEKCWNDLKSVQDFLFPENEVEMEIFCKKSFFNKISNSELRKFDICKSQVPVDIAIAVFYHIILQPDTQIYETLTFLKKILVFLELNEEFSEMVNIGRKTRKICNLAGMTNAVLIDEVVEMISKFLSKAGKKFMLLRLKKPASIKRET